MYNPSGHNSFLRRFILGFAIASFPIFLAAQPVTIPQQNFPSFQSQDMDPLFQSANQSQSYTGYLSLILQGVAVMRASWETQADNLMIDQLNLVNSSDDFNGNPEYREVLRDALLLQRSNAQADWESAAQQRIFQESTGFLAALSAKDLNAAKENTEQDTKDATTPPQPGTLFDTAQSELEKDRLAWEKEFKNQIDQGNSKWSLALQALDQNYANAEADVLQTDQQYQQHLAELQAYEQRVRDGIQTQTSQLRNYLQTSGLFFDEGCTAPCSINTAGAELTTLLDAMDQKLAQNQPLSQIVQDMETYLTTQEQYSQNKENYWTGLSTGSINDNNWYGYSGNPGQVSGDTRLNAIRAYAMGEGSSALVSYLETTNPGKQITGITGGNLCGSSTNYSPFGFNNVGSWGGGDCFSNAGYGALSFTAAGIAGWPPFIWVDVQNFNEQYIVENLSYNWFDPGAQANAQTWNGYKNDVAGLKNTWQNSLKPAIGNWESQVQNYQSEYAAFQTRAQQQLLDASTARDAAQQSVLDQRSKWLNSMDAAHADGQKQWNIAAINLDQQKALFNQPGVSNPNEQKAKEDIKTLFGNLPGSIHNEPDVLTALRDASKNLPGIKHEEPCDTLPDTKLLDLFSKETSTTLGATLNLGVSKTMDTNAINTREAAIDEIVNAARSMDGVITSMLHPDRKQESSAKGEAIDAGFRVERLADGTVQIHRMVATGRAIKKAFTDGLNESDYEAELREEIITISGVSTIKLKNGGKLTDDWDMNHIMSSYEEQKEKFNKNLDTKFDLVGKQLEERNNEAGKAADNYHKDAQKQISEANTMKDLISNLLTGGTIDSWIQGQVRGKIAGAIEAATGFPAGFITGIMSGQKPHQAAESFVTSLAWQNLEKTLGIEGISSLLQKMKGDQDAKKAEKKAKQLKPEDLMTGGATYFMRTAQYNHGALGQMDKVMSANPMYGAVKQAYLEGGGIGKGLNTVLNGVKSTVSNIASTMKNVLKGDLKAIATSMVAGMTGIPLGGQLVTGTDSDKLFNKKHHATLGEYTGLDEVGHTTLTAAKVYGGMATKIANTIQTNTLKGAADLAGNDRLKEKIKMRGDMNYAAASDFTHNLGLGARGGIMSLAMTTGNPFVVVGSAILMANNKVFSRIEKGLVATYAEKPILMDATTGVIGGGAYTAWKIREGWVKGGDKGAVVAAGSLALQAFSAGTASGALDLGTSNLANILEHTTGSMSYDRENGFSASLGVADFGGKLGGGLSYSDGNGLGVSLNAGDSNGLSGSVGFSARGGISVGGSYGQKNGPAFGLSYDKANGFGANVSNNFKGDPGSSTSGLGVSAGLSQYGGWNAGLKYSGKADSRYGETGVGLNYSRGWDGKDSVSISMSTKGVNVGTLTDRGVGTINPTLLHDYAQAIKQEQNLAKLAQKNQERIENMNPAERAKLMESIGLDSSKSFRELEPEQQDALLDAEHNARIQKDIADGKILDTSGMNASRGDSIMDDFFGDIEDGWHEMLGGGVADKWGYFDSKGNYASRNCFAINEPVWTLNGIVKIQDVKSGDSVIAYDQKTGRLTESRVNETFVRKSDRLILVHYGDRVVKTTPTHPFYIAGRGWIPAGELRAGMRSPTIAAIAKHNALMAMSGGYRLQAVSFGTEKEAVLLPEDLAGSEEITSVEVVMGEETVYNFTVEGQHDYFVGESMVLVHNVEYSQNTIAYFNAQTKIEHEGLEYEKKTRVENGKTVTYFEAYDEFSGRYFTLEMTDDKRGIVQSEYGSNADGSRKETRISGSRVQDMRVGLGDDPGSEDYTAYMDESDFGAETFEPEKPKQTVQKPVAQPAKDNGITAEQILAKVNEWSPAGLAFKLLDWIKESGTKQYAKLMTPQEKKDLIIAEAKKLGVEPELLESFIEVESKNISFDRDGNVITRVEIHAFDQKTGGKFSDHLTYSPVNKAKAHGFREDVDGQFENPHANPITKSETVLDKNAQELSILTKLAKLNSQAAYESSSFGLGQILGENYHKMGYSSPQEMFADFNKGDEQQLRGMVKFIQTKDGLLPALKKKDANGIVAGYNGGTQLPGCAYRCLPGQPEYVDLLRKAYKERTGKDLK